VSEEQLKSVITGRVSTELYEKSIGWLNNQDPRNLSLDYKNCIIHLIDSVSRGYTTPSEAYDALKADYFPELLKVRRSLYQHLV